jgi:hypothetical protein
MAEAGQTGDEFGADDSNIVDGFAALDLYVGLQSLDDPSGMVPNQLNILDL